MSPNLLDIFALMDQLKASGEEFCVVTVVRTAAATSAKAGAKAIVCANGQIHGFIGGGCVTGAVKRVGLQTLQSGEPKLIRVKPIEESGDAVDGDGVELHTSSCPSGGTVDLFFEPMRQRPRLVVFGTSPVAIALVRLAGAMGHSTIIAAQPDDHDRLGDISDERFDGFDLAPLLLGDRDAVVVATQGRRDSQALAGALASNAGYTGMVGSQKKIATLIARLGEPTDAAALAALHGPAGLAIGAIDPEEIALSILAEIIAKRRAKGTADDLHQPG